MAGLETAQSLTIKNKNMPKLKDIIKLETIKFDNGIEIVIAKEMTYGGVLSAIKNSHKEDSDDNKIDDNKKFEIAAESLLAYIVKWNLEDDDGDTLVITIENIKKLPNDIVIDMINKVYASEELKKKTEKEI